MNDEDKKLEQNNNGQPTKESIANQLNSFINPAEKQKTESAILSNYLKPKQEQEPVSKIAEIPEPPKENRPIVRTYKSDVESTIQTNHISSINIAIAENKKMLDRDKQTEIEEKKSKTNKKILIISLLLIFGGALTFLIPKLLVQIQYAPKQAPVETVSSKPIMTADVEEKINLKDINTNRLGTTLKERIEQSSTQLGQIKNIYLTEGDGVNEKLITSIKFLALIGANYPSEIQRTLKDQYMFGLHNYSGNQTFLILKVGSYDTAFPGMLNWESNLWQDFKELFNLQGPNSTDTTSQAKRFQDATFNNKDCRVIKDSSGNIIFLYSIIDDNTFVITTSADTLKEIINRTSKAKVVTQ